jgi:pectate lyase
MTTGPLLAARRLGFLFAAFAMPGPATAQAPEVDPALLELAREPATVGWATVEGGTTGGAAAADDAIHVVASRAELVAALGGDNASNADNGAPAIIFVSGTIDLTEDDAGNQLTAADFADPEYDWDAYLAAYDPATYGMEAEPEGPEEDARARSQANQAAHTVIDVGSNKTLFGLGADAVIRHGTLNIDGVSNVVVRNIRFQDSYDLFPALDGTDGDEGSTTTRSPMATAPTTWSRRSSAARCSTTTAPSTSSTARTSRR